MPRRAYSYLRFSGKRQAQGDSQRRQREFAVRIAAEEGALLDDSLTRDDLGVSAFRGRNAQVGALAQFLEAIQTGRVSPGSILILESIDRLSRNTVGQALQLFISVLNHGVEIITAEPRRKYSADSINDIASILEPLIYMSRAHEESKTKSMRIRAAWGQKMKHARAEKRPAWGSVPAWIVRTAEGFRLDPDRAEAVRLIFRLAVEGMGARRIAQELNDRGIPPQGHSDRWALSYIKLILKSRSVCGEYQPGSRGDDGRRAPQGEPISGYYPPVVSESDFWAAQAAARGRRKCSGRAGQSEANLFTGILRAAPSGERMYAMQRTAAGRRYRYLTTRGEHRATSRTKFLKTLSSTPPTNLGRKTSPRPAGRRRRITSNGKST